MARRGGSRDPSGARPGMFRPRVADVQQDESSTTSRSTSTDDVVFEASARGRQHANPLPVGRAPLAAGAPALGPRACRPSRSPPRRTARAFARSSPGPRRGARSPLGPVGAARRSFGVVATRLARRCGNRSPRATWTWTRARGCSATSPRASSRRRRGGSRARPGAARTTRPATGPDRPPLAARRETNRTRGTPSRRSSTTPPRARSSRRRGRAGSGSSASSSCSPPPASSSSSTPTSSATTSSSPCS